MRAISFLRLRDKTVVEPTQLGWEVNPAGKFVWLQKLALKILERFGKKADVELRSVERAYIDHNVNQVITAVEIQIVDLKRSNLKPVCIYLGHEEFNGINESLSFFRPSAIQSELYGLPIIAVPNLRGVFVAPEAS